MRRLFGATDIGLVRTANQDIFMLENVSATLSYAVLCDGMGGERGGGVASRIAAEHAFSALARELRDGAEYSELTLRSMLLSAVAGANALVFQAAKNDLELTGMGTTMVLAVFYRDTLYIACVGDSRAYRVSALETRQLTRDHTVVQMLIDMGEITREEAKVHPKRNFITRAVGVAAVVESDFIVEELNEGDAVLLCSDGLSGYTEPDELNGLLRQCAGLRDASPLIELAKSRGGADNITAVVFADCVEEQ